MAGGTTVGDLMKTLVLVFLSWAASANAQSVPVVNFCFGPADLCAQKIGHTAVASALPQESQVLLADNFRWEAPIPLAKVPQIPVMIARNEKPKAGSHWGRRVESTADSENGRMLSQAPTTATAAKP
jgi:hypothetical protein